VWHLCCICCRKGLCGVLVRAVGCVRQAWQVHRHRGSLAVGQLGFGASGGWRHGRWQDRLGVSLPVTQPHCAAVSQGRAVVLAGALPVAGCVLVPVLNIVCVPLPAVLLQGCPEASAPLLLHICEALAAGCKA
jgi:hypothetical protein